jgi:DNA-binding response OmpR family regulator
VKRWAAWFSAIITSSLLPVEVVEDERRIARLLCRGLEEEGRSVQGAFDGDDGLRWSRTQAFDAMILDVMLPQLSAFEAARTLRSEKIDTPVVILTAKDAVADIDFSEQSLRNMD